MDAGDDLSAPLDVLTARNRETTAFVATICLPALDIFVNGTRRFIGNLHGGRVTFKVTFV